MELYMQFHISSSMNGFEGYNDLFYREYYSQNRQKPCLWMEMKEILENRSIEYKAFQTRYAGHAIRSGTEDFFSSRGQDLSDHRGR